MFGAAQPLTIKETARNSRAQPNLLTLFYAYPEPAYLACRYLCH